MRPRFDPATGSQTGGTPSGDYARPPTTANAFDFSWCRRA